VYGFFQQDRGIILEKFIMLANKLLEKISLSFFFITNLLIALPVSAALVTGTPVPAPAAPVIPAQTTTTQTVTTQTTTTAAPADPVSAAIAAGKVPPSSTADAPTVAVKAPVDSDPCQALLDACKKAGYTMGSGTHPGMDLSIDCKMKAYDPKVTSIPGVALGPDDLYNCRNKTTTVAVTKDSSTAAGQAGPQPSSNTPAVAVPAAAAYADPGG
jgi:hypothetical protein